MDLYEGIYQRYSVRSFKQEPVDEQILKGLQTFIEELEPLFGGIQVNISMVNSLNKKIKTRGIANFSAPYYIVVYSAQSEKSDMNAGYIMEQMVLYLFTHGIASCYLGMASIKNKAMEDMGMYPAIMIGFGKPKKPLEFREREPKRLPLDNLCSYKEEPKSTTKGLMDAARMAPSAFNSQPWRFVVYKKRFHVFSKKPVVNHSKLGQANEVNFGIMLAHVMIAAEHFWVDVDLIKLNNITHKSIPNNQYVISVLLNS